MGGALGVGGVLEVGTREVGTREVGTPVEAGSSEAEGRHLPFRLVEMPPAADTQMTGHPACSRQIPNRSQADPPIRFRF